MASDDTTGVPALDSMLTRRSIRSYAADPVADDLIRGILAGAMSAPSAGNERPWQFVVLRDRALLERVPTVHPYASMVPGAAAAILVCGDLRLEAHEGYWVQDCAAATENLLLAAHALGLGAVWLGVHPRVDRVSGLRGLLELPDHVVPFALVPFGVPGEQKPPAERYDEGRVHWDRW